jgi:hypothetical protein
VTPQEIAAEHKELARMRTLEFLAKGKLASVPDADPRRAALQRKMRDVSSRLRTLERAHEDGR